MKSSRLLSPGASQSRTHTEGENQPWVTWDLITAHDSKRVYQEAGSYLLTLLFLVVLEMDLGFQV